MYKIFTYLNLTTIVLNELLLLLSFVFNTMQSSAQQKIAEKSLHISWTPY
ncbi:MAG: hypothetical protein ACI9UT_001339 [Flavobacteriales bacterium]|jgi:hypothetical protein